MNRRPLGYEPFSNRDWNQRATKKGSEISASHVFAFRSLWLPLGAASWVIPGRSLGKAEDDPRGGWLTWSTSRRRASGPRRPIVCDRLRLTVAMNLSARRVARSPLLPNHVGRKRRARNSVLHDLGQGVRLWPLSHACRVATRPQGSPMVQRRLNGEHHDNANGAQHYDPHST